MISNQKLWNEYVKKNKSSYGKACVDVARRVMEILDKNGGDFEPNELLNRADDEVGGGGLTGFMAGSVAVMIKQCHSRGDEFNRKWNESFGVKSNKGTVNPAIVTLDTKNNK